MKKRKAMALFLSTAMVAGIAAGCSSTGNGSSADGSGSGSGDGKEKLVITYVDPADNGEEAYMYKWIMDTYEKWDRKDEVEIELQAIVANDSDYFTKIQTQMQDPSTSPDIFLEDTFQLNTDVAAGYVADLTSYVAGWEDWNTGIIEALKEGTKGADGNTYAVPISTDVRGLWYNKDVMEQAGLGRDWQPESWQDILDACEAIKTNCDDDVVPIWFACSNTEAEATTMNTFSMLLYGTGETLVDESTGVWNMTGQGIVDSLKFIETCKTNGYIGTLSEVFDASDWEYPISLDTYSTSSPSSKQRRRTSYLNSADGCLG